MKSIDVFVSLVFKVFVMSVKLLNLLLSKSLDILHGAILNEKIKEMRLMILNLYFKSRKKLIIYSDID